MKLFTICGLLVVISVGAVLVQATASSFVCSPEISIVLNQTDLDAMEITNATNQLYLGKHETCYPDDGVSTAALDDKCRAEYDGAEATFTVSSNKCHSSLKVVDGLYIFKYIVTKIPTIDEANPVQRYSCAEKEFECVIPTNQNLTSANVTTEILHINSTKVTGESAYQLDISIGTSSPVEVGQDISVAISLVNVVTPTDYQLTATRCSAQPEDGSSQYDILDCHGCMMNHTYDSPGDITLTKNGIVGDDVEFSFKAFTWTNKNATEQKIFIHCDVNVCDNVAETCGAAPSCPNTDACPSKRFRRGLPTSDDTRVSFGPILVKRKAKSEGIVHPLKIFSVML